VFRRLARDLVLNVGRGLYALREQYDDLVRTGAPDATLTRGIDAAVREANQWVDNGFGTGSEEAWFAHIEGPWVVGYREATQTEYYNAKTKITQCFANVDDSLEEAIHEVWNQVAATLRLHLTSALVPAAPTGLEALIQLRDTADRSSAPLIHEALDQLLRLGSEYGSLVRRVTGPIIRELDPAAMPPSPRATGVVIDGGEATSRTPVPLYTALTAAAHTTITQLQQRLTDEAHAITGFLAQALHDFFESMVRPNDVAWDYESICGPYRGEIWPAEFAGDVPGLAAELSALQKQAQLMIAAVPRLP
jgi:hypothetical protein